MKTQFGVMMHDGRVFRVESEVQPGVTFSSSIFDNAPFGMLAFAEMIFNLDNGEFIKNRRYPDTVKHADEALVEHAKTWELKTDFSEWQPYLKKEETGWPYDIEIN
jgi:hypothetical protein